MMGLYPASNYNDLSDWQQGNAVPPMEGADFSAQQQELGAHALPYGLNIFPIQNTGLEVDFKLALNEQNCPLFKENFYPTGQALNDVALQGLPLDVADMIKADGSNMREFCNYLEWAWITSVPLQNQLKYDRIRRDDCHTYQTSYVNALRQFEQSNSYLIATDYMISVRDHVAVASGIYNYSETSHGKMHKKQMEFERVNGDPLPNVFHAYTALSADTLYLFAFATLDEEDLEKATLGFRVLPDSSTLVFEVDSANNVHAYLNDRKVAPNGCSPGMDCSAQTFLDAINKRIYWEGDGKDVQSTCFINDETMFTQ